MRLLYVALQNLKEVEGQRSAIKAVENQGGLIVEEVFLYNEDFELRLKEKILDFNPQIIHFAGHGDLDGIVLPGNRRLSHDALFDFFPDCPIGSGKRAGDVRLVSFCVCNSSSLIKRVRQFFPSAWAIGVDGEMYFSAVFTFCEKLYANLLSDPRRDFLKAFEDTKKDSEFRKLPTSEKVTRPDRRETPFKALERQIGDNLFAERIVELFLKEVLEIPQKMTELSNAIGLPDDINHTANKDEIAKEVIRKLRRFGCQPTLADLVRFLCKDKNGSFQRFFTILCEDESFAWSDQLIEFCGGRVDGKRALDVLRAFAERVSTNERLNKG